MKKSAIFIAISLFLTTLVLPLITVAQVQEKGNISVSTTVPSQARDYQFAFAYKGSSLLHQDMDIEYEITYGASSSAGLDTPSTIIVYYSTDRAPDNSYIADYVIGSASEAYGGVQPIVNTVERTITWIIPELPAGVIDQKVTFKLQTNANYGGNKRITFWSRAHMSTPHVDLNEQKLHQDYLFSTDHINHGPTPTPLPPTPVPPTPAPPYIPLRPLDISLQTIAATQAAILVSLNKPGLVTMRYGTTTDALTRSSTNSQYLYSHELDMENLRPDTTYYFQLTSSDTQGIAYTSEYFTFRTAAQTPPPGTGNDALVIMSNEIVLLSQVLGTNQKASDIVVVPSNTSYQLIYTLGSPTTLSTIELIIRNEQGEASSIGMRAKDAQTFTAQTRTTEFDTYRLEMRTIDAFGNIITRPLATLSVVPPIRVIDKKTNAPIGDARLVLWYYNPQKQQYEQLTRIQSQAFPNPVFTNAQGELVVVLPTGKYRIEASAVGYESQSVDFNLGENNDRGYPTIELESNPWSLQQLSLVMMDGILDTTEKIQALTAELAQSARVFNIIATATMASLSALGLLLFNIRAQINWQDMMPFFFFHIMLANDKHKQTHLSGVILDESNQPLSKVRIEIIDPATNEVLTHTTSNRAGHFHVRNTFIKTVVSFLYTKEGYATLMLPVETNTQHELHVSLKHHTEHIKPVISELEHMSGSFFEIVLLAGLLFQLIFFIEFGFVKTLPFFIVSVFNIFLWLFYLREHERKI